MVWNNLACIVRIRAFSCYLNASRVQFRAGKMQDQIPSAALNAGWFRVLCRVGLMYDINADRMRNKDSSSESVVVVLINFLTNVKCKETDALHQKVAFKQKQVLFSAARLVTGPSSCPLERDMFWRARIKRRLGADLLLFTPRWCLVRGFEPPPQPGQWPPS